MKRTSGGTVEMIRVADLDRLPACGCNRCAPFGSPRNHLHDRERKIVVYRVAASALRRP